MSSNFFNKKSLIHQKMANNVWNDPQEVLLYLSLSIISPARNKRTLALISIDVLIRQTKRGGELCLLQKLPIKFFMNVFKTKAVKSAQANTHEHEVISNGSISLTYVHSPPT